KINATEPTAASQLGGKEWAPHKVQGWTPDVLPEVLSRAVHDELVPVTDDAAIDPARRLATQQGLFVGIPAGPPVAASLEVAAGAPEGSVLLATLPDAGERYFSTPLFSHRNEGSDDDWLAGLDGAWHAA